MRVGEIIRKWRVVEERSLRDVAAEIGISHGTLQRVERGEMVDTGTFIKLLAWLTNPPEKDSPKGGRPRPR